MIPGGYFQTKGDQTQWLGDLLTNLLIWTDQTKIISASELKMLHLLFLSTLQIFFHLYLLCPPPPPPPPTYESKFLSRKIHVKPIVRDSVALSVLRSNNKVQNTFILSTHVKVNVDQFCLHKCKNNSHNTKPSHGSTLTNTTACWQQH